MPIKNLKTNLSFYKKILILIPFIIWSISSRGAPGALETLSLGEESPLQLYWQLCSQGSHSQPQTILLNDWNKRVHTSPAARGTVWQPAALIGQFFLSLPSLYLLYLAGISILKGNIHLPSPPHSQVGRTWWERNIQKPWRYWQCQCHPYLVHKLSKRGPQRGAWIQWSYLGPRVPATGLSVPWFSSGHEYSSHSFQFPLGIPKNLLWPEGILSKRKWGYFFKKCSRKGLNHRLDLWHFNSFSVH